MLQMQHYYFFNLCYSEGRVGEVKMKIIKRDGHIVDYSPEKIEKAIMKANAEVEEEEQVSSTQIKNIIKKIS